MGFDTRRKSDKPVSCHCQILCPPVICESVNHRLHFFDPFSPTYGIKVCRTELVNPRLKVSHREISSLVARWQGFCTVIVVSTKLRNCGLLHMDGGNPLVKEQIILIGSLEGCLNSLSAHRTRKTKSTRGSTLVISLTLVFITRKLFKCHRWRHISARLHSLSFCPLSTYSLPVARELARSYVWSDKVEWLLIEKRTSNGWRRKGQAIVEGEKDKQQLKENSNRGRIGQAIEATQRCSHREHYTGFYLNLDLCLWHPHLMISPNCYCIHLHLTYWYTAFPTCTQSMTKLLTQESWGRNLESKPAHHPEERHINLFMTWNTLEPNILWGKSSRLPYYYSTDSFFHPLHEHC